MAKSENKKSMRGTYQKARRVDPLPITGKEPPTQVIEHAFSAYVGRQERTAFELMKRSMDENCSIFLTLSGAMTPAGLHQSCLIPMIERGVISALTTTGANLYHDAHRMVTSSCGSRGSSGSTISGSGRRRCSTPTGSSPRSSAGRSSRRR
jgi:deoxyhypusine synthase